jgi:hypothetical protein
MSGQANVVAWLAERGLEAGPETVERIFAAAKVSDRVLRDEEILALLPLAPEPRRRPRAAEGWSSQA